MSRYKPEQVIPGAIRPVVEPLPYWFVIGGHAVRCFCPYRPTRDVDFGVREAPSIEALLGALEESGTTEVLDKSADTVHLTWNDIGVSIFLLEEIGRYTEERRLDVKGILATKVHAIIDRGTRRDFFDLYVTLQDQQLGIAEALVALRTVYAQEINDSLVLRALTWFEDAEREAPLPGEGGKDWQKVQDFFLTRVGSLIVPPSHVLEIQRLLVDVDGEPSSP